MRLRKHIRHAIPIALLASLCSPALRALERVNLHNGFSYDCTHRETLPSGQVRLYLSAASTVTSSEPNYIDLRAEQIASVESLPDAAPVAPVGQPTALPNASLSSSPEDLHLLLAHAGSIHNIDRELLASIVHAESSGHRTAVSRAGARGLMQLMPGTAREMGVADAFKPEDNINGGTAYLDLLLTRYRDNLALALAAYNAGPAAVDRFRGVPPFRETRLYVARVMNEFKRRKAALQTALASR